MAKTKNSITANAPYERRAGRLVASGELPPADGIVADALAARNAPPGERTVAVLPLGATEQHGPHLSPNTDWIIADAMAARAATLADADTMVLPAERIGYSPEHLGWEATRTLGYGDAVERWCAIGGLLAHQGVWRLVLLNAHGGNAPLLAVAATEMRMRYSMLCVATSWTRHGDPAVLVGTPEKTHGIHAGLIETSVILALRPDLVSMERAEAFGSLQQRHERERALLRAYGPHAHGWTMEDLNPDGATGDAASATAALGEALIADAVQGLARLIEEVAAFDPPWREPAPSDLAHS